MRRVARGRSVRAGAPRLAVSATWRAPISTRWSACWPSGFTTRRGRRAALIHRDEVQRPPARHAIGAADRADLGRRHSRRRRLSRRARSRRDCLGTLNEDFAIESNAGDIFQLGNSSWRILQVAAGVVRVADAHGAPPTIPFWLGEAPGRTRGAVGRGQRSAARARARLGLDAGDAAAREWLIAESGVCATAAAADRRRTCRDSLRLPRRAADRRTRSSSSGSSTTRAACSWCCTRRSAAASTAPGRWRCASASAGSSTSSCRRPPPRRACCCRSARSTRFRSPTCSATCIRRHRARHPGPGVPRRAGVPDALAVERHHLAGRAAA